jgi:hypothetical protein
MGHATSSAAPVRTGRPAHPGAILAVVLVSYFMILLDNSVIFTAIPSLRSDLALTPGEMSWVRTGGSGNASGRGNRVLNTRGGRPSQALSPIPAAF